MPSLLAGLISAILGAAAALLAPRKGPLPPPASHFWLRGRFSSGHAPVREFLVFNFGLAALMLLPFALFFWQVRFSLPAAGWFVLAVALDFAGNYLYFRAFEQDEPLHAASLLGLTPAFTLLTATLFSARQSVSSGVWFSAALLALGIGLLSWQSGTQPGRKNLLFQIGIPLLSAACFGISVFPVKALLDAQALNPFSYYLLRAVIICGLGWIFFRPRWTWVSFPAVIYTCTRLLTVLGQWLLMLSALQNGSVLVVKTVAETSPLFVLGGTWLVEKRTPALRQGAGAVCIVCGLLLLSGFHAK